MAKIDWEKVEKLLGEGLEDYDIADFQKAVKKLMDAADSGVRRQELPVSMPAASTVALLLVGSRRDLNKIDKQAPELIQKNVKDRKTIEEFEERLDRFTQEDWDKFRELKKEISLRLMEVVSASAEIRDKALIKMNVLELRKTGKYYFKESARKHWRTV